MPDEIEQIPAKCSNCGAIIGHMVQAAAGAKLRVDGGWLIVEGSRRCPDCGRMFYFKPPTHSWIELVARFKRSNGTLAGEKYLNGD